MKVAFCSSEVVPFSKTGGLADVAGALSAALARAGSKVKVFTPYYKGVVPGKDFSDYGYLKQGGVEFYFVKNDAYFKRDGLYNTQAGDYPDNLERFSFFNKAVLEILKDIGFSPDIIHCNDWQASLLPVYLKTNYSGSRFFAETKALLTIHNLSFQGIFDFNQWSVLDLPARYFNHEALEYYGKINLLKGGIVFSDAVNTVSPTYALQTQTSDYGCGLEGVLRARRAGYRGILNGIDYSVWNPAKDDLIHKKYSARTISYKAANKRYLRQQLGLAAKKNCMLLGMVSRLTHQKGIDILLESLEYMLGRSQVVILGRGEAAACAQLRKKAKKYSASLAVNFKFDERLAHQIYAGSDAFLVPSRFEPCGLSQMISFKYGTIPIVHNTGGLTDTVTDAAARGNGFVFDNYSGEDLIVAVGRAHEAYTGGRWPGLIKRAMAMNFSWSRTVEHYLHIYAKLKAGKRSPCIL